MTRADVRAAYLGAGKWKLTLDNVSSGYGHIVALRNVSFSLSSGEVLSLVGPNSAGKSTTTMTLAGSVKPLSGQIYIDAEDVTNEPPYRRVLHGITLVPEGRRVFAELSVHENLTVGGHHLDGRALKKNFDRVVQLFPRLAERLKQNAGSLSGGEQQMLAIGRVIISSPKLVLIDELSLGLMPKVVDECYEALGILKIEGLAVLLVEQNTEQAIQVVDHVVALDSGDLAGTGSGDEARLQPEALSAHF